MQEKSIALSVLARQRFWVLQCNPEYYRIADALVAGRSISWPVSRLWNEIKVGDGAFVWVSGRNAGVYAIGRIDAPADYVRSIPDHERWLMSERFRNKKFVVVEILSVLDTPFARDAALTDPILREMNVVRTPMGSVFRVSEAQRNRLLHLMKALTK